MAKTYQVNFATRMRDSLIMIGLLLLTVLAGFAHNIQRQDESH